MGWISNDGQHEGYLAAVLVDGAISTTNNSKGPVVLRFPDNAGKHSGRGEQRSDDEVVGWRLFCTCASPAAGGRGSIWVGDMWERVPTPALESVDKGRIYVAAGEPASDVAERPAVAEIARARWHTVHVSPLDALTAIRQAQENIAAEAELLNEAVAAARSAGQTWQKIGDAAGMSRQAAQERWNSTRKN